MAFLCDTSIPSELNGYEQLRKRQLELHFFVISVGKLIANDLFFNHAKKNYQLKKKRQQRVDNELCFDHIQKEFKLSLQKKKWEHHVTKPQTTHDESCFLANALHEYAYKLLHDFLHCLFEC